MVIYIIPENEATNALVHTIIYICRGLGEGRGGEERGGIVWVSNTI